MMPLKLSTFILTFQKIFCLNLSSFHLRFPKLFDFSHCNVSKLLSAPFCDVALFFFSSYVLYLFDNVIFGIIYFRYILVYQPSIQFQQPI